MKIAILGAGHVGGTLGQKWAAAGHEVVFGVRNPEEKRQGVKFGSGQLPISFENVRTALDKAKVVVVAIPGRAAAELASELAPAFDGKIVIDASNNLQGPEMSCLGAIQRAAPQARSFRAFNSLGWEVFANPDFGGQTADLLYCGADDMEAQSVVENLISDVGLRPVRVGGLEVLAQVDMLVQLWLALARGRGLGRHTAFKVLSDEAV